MILPPVLRALHVPQPPEQAFDLFTRSIGAWWPLPTHGLFGAESAEVAFENDRIVEHAADGRSTVWGEVLAWEPPGRLLLSWHPGDPSGDAGEVEVRFLPSDGGGTRIELSHAGWHAFGERAAAVRRAYGGRDAWGTVLDHLADLAERQAPAAGPGAPGSPGWEWPEVDRAGLEAAYTAFYAEAGKGGFAAPAPGEWSGPQVIAHVAVNDGLLAAVVRGLIHDRTPRLENVIAIDQAVLDAWVQRQHGDPAALAAAGRLRADRLIDLLTRLDAEQFATPVPTRIVHGGEVVVDAELPWARVIGMQITGHLPGHTDQLRALRS